MMATMMNSDTMRASYKKLRPFLRVVQLYRSEPYGYWYVLVPSDDDHRLFVQIIRDKRQFRLFYRPGRGFAAVVWLPNDQRLVNPTYMEFCQAYGCGS